MPQRGIGKRNMFEIMTQGPVVAIRPTGHATVSDLHEGVIWELDGRGVTQRMNRLRRRLGAPPEPYTLSNLATNLEGVLQDGLVPTSLSGWIKAVVDEFEANLDAFLSNCDIQSI